jgi:3-phosphoshikimate 1-carboxyvinyltransferase
MTERPIKVLVEALEQLEQKYPMKKEVGYPYSDQRSKITASKVTP